MSADARRKALESAVANLLRERRLAAGLSMTQLARKAGLSQPMIGFVEQGARKPTLDTLLRICDALDEDIVKILASAKRTAGLD
jgi:transcriptional regulator with XRE-family HTH domain